MTDYNPTEYGDLCAAFYDDLYPTIETGLLDTLISLSGGGPVLELGLATGRVARRLNEAGLFVHGVEASQAMIERCRSLPGASGLHIVRGDFAALPYSGPFGLVFALVNTLSLLPSRDLLIRCLRDVARILAPDGVFVYETYTVAGSSSAVTHDYPILTGAGVQNYRVTSLDTSPEIFDQLANTVGLHLLDVWQDWQRNAVTASSARRIMVYGPALDGTVGLDIIGRKQS